MLEKLSVTPNVAWLHFPKKVHGSPGLSEAQLSRSAKEQFEHAINLCSQCSMFHTMASWLRPTPS